MTDFFWGALFTIGLAVVIPLAYVLAALLVSVGNSMWLWLHVRLAARVERLDPDPAVVVFSSSSDPELVEVRRDTHERAIRRITAALRRSPKVLTFEGLGWRVMVVREYKEAAPQRTR